MPSQEHEQIVAMLIASARANAGAAEIPLDERRSTFDAMLGALPIADDVTIEPFEIGAMAADWVSVPTSRPDRVLLYLHGGGYMIGSNVAYREFCSRVARATEARVCVIDYRLAPEHPFPAAVADAVTAYRWLLDQDVAPHRLVVAGDSAGGGLTLATLVRLRDEGAPLPACAAVFSPWTDLEGTGASARPGAVDDPLIRPDALASSGRVYAPEDPRHPLASPLYADLAGLPPLSVQVGSREVLLDDSARLRDKAQAIGVPVSYFEGEGLIHVWPVLAPHAPESKAALERLGAFVTENLN
jgi:epsilon-lactone hydrolase